MDQQLNALSDSVDLISSFTRKIGRTQHENYDKFIETIMV